MEKIKRLLLYAGANPEEFAQVQQEMHLYNYNRLVAFLAISILFLLMSSVSAVFSVVLAPNLPAYLIVLSFRSRFMSVGAAESVCRSVFLCFWARCIRSASISAP